MKCFILLVAAVVVGVTTIGCEPKATTEKKSEMTTKSPQGTTKTTIDQKVETSPGTETRTTTEKTETKPAR